MDIGYHDFHMLSMGDLEAAGEQKMLPYINQTSQQYNILKVSHHGSNTSTSENFLSIVNPEMAIVSCGENNPYGHPHKEVILRLQNSGCQILQTRMSGCINIHVNKNGKKKVTGFVR
jgi:competence protein ComEC